MQSLGNLAVPHVFNVLQHDHIAMLWRKLCKRPVDMLPNFSAFAVKPGTWKIRGNCFVQALSLGVGPSGEESQSPDQCDTIEPRIERRSTLKPVDRSPRFHKSFLGKIPSLALITHNVADRRKYFGAVLRYQFTERLRVTSLRSPGQLQFQEL
jgi:hypothetical protein